MLTLIFIALLIATAFAVYKWYASVKAEIVAAKATVESDVAAVEVAVQADAKVAETETAKVVDEIKAKL